MYRDTGTASLVYSPSDLIRYMESPFASWMERFDLEYPNRLVPDETSAEQKLVQQTGDRHEQSFLQTLQSSGRDIAVIEKRAPDAEALTRAALVAGREIVYQGCLSDGVFRGFADFLVRTDARHGDGFIYEVWDTKLARKTKPYYLVQLCCYAELLETIQGIQPGALRVVLGNNEIPAYSTEDFFYYYRQLKEAFLTQMAEFDPDKMPVPDPRADHGRWQSLAEKQLVEMDHLFQVARITSGQIRKLNAAGITTMAQLGAAESAKLRMLSQQVAERLVDQARLQIATTLARSKGGPDEFVPPIYRVLQPDGTRPRQGLALLPPPSPGDVFFDMEGFPLAAAGPLEYLFGAVFREGNAMQFVDWWAHDSAEERKAFEDFVDWAYERWRRDPSMHIYHYASYEVTALCRLMGQHGTREDQLDDLLRHDVFVDLYKVVQQGLRIGEPSYSIKLVERLYRGKRGGDVTAAGESMVYYANWIESGGPRDWRQAPILEKIRSYNRDDCESTCQLYDWLRSEQQQAGITFVASPKGPEDRKTESQLKEAAQRTELLQKLALLARDENDPKRRAIHEMLLHLVEFHRRESKPIWWRMFDRAEQEPDELEADIACIGNARKSTGSPVPDKKSLIFTYRFNPDQDTKITVGDRVYALPSLAATLNVVALNAEVGEIKVKLGRKALDEQFGGDLPSITSFIPNEFVSPAVIEASIERLAWLWVNSGKLPGAFIRLLQRTPPVLGAELLRREGENASDAAVRCSLAMQSSSLCIQGPPGTGKTFTAAKSILALLREGRRVGITSNSRKAIENLLRECHAQSGGSLESLYVANEVDDSLMAACPGLEISESGDAHTAYSGGLVAGTAWLFTRPEWEDSLDQLFIDEAGQVSLANVAAMSASAKNLIVVGDQMQLEHPVQGAHPGDSGRATLEYYLNGHATVPPDLGLFLAETHRLHPDICRFVSDLVYEGRLKAALGNENRRVARVGGLPDAGIAFVPVIHDGNTQASDEEVTGIRALTQVLLGCQKFDRHGGPAGVISIEDILYVAPYNAQVRRLRDALPANARVGSVDKFQGQEADIVILSMCSSFGEYGSRGLEFILDRNRMNVALSRARTLAIVVGDPRIATAPAHSIDTMRRINLYCRLVQQHSQAGNQAHAALEKAGAR